MKTKALLVSKVNCLEYRELDVPEVGEYDVLFHTQAVSLCTVDRRAYLGTRTYKMPFLGGHECSGIVEKVGSKVVGVKEGDHAVFTSAYCMQCELDRTNRGTQCRNKLKQPQRVCLPEGYIQGGGLSEYLVIPCWQIIAVDKKVNLDDVCLTEPLACCVHSVRKARIRFAETVVIIGMGIMGYFHLKLALMRGARVIVSETDPSRQAFAREQGAWKVIDPLKEDLHETISSLTNGLGADVVFNTIPAASVWNQAIEILAPYGRLMAYSSQDSKQPIGVNFGEIHSREIELIGTLNPTLHDNDIAVKLISYGLIDMRPVIGAKFPFDQAKEAFEKALEPGMYRVVIKY